MLTAMAAFITLPDSASTDDVPQVGQQHVDLYTIVRDINLCF